MADELTRLRDEIQRAESPSRFQHTLGVEREVAALGEILLPQAVMELRAAALLHDVTKCLSDDEQFALCRKYEIPLSDEYLNSPQVLHGLTAEKLIPERYPAYATPQILHAISVHTTGDADMNLFDKILFVADYTEEGRKYSACKAMRERLWQGLPESNDPFAYFDGIVFAILKETIEYLAQRNCLIVSKTRIAYQDLAKRTGEQMEEKENYGK